MSDDLVLDYGYVPPGDIVNGVQILSYDDAHVSDWRLYHSDFEEWMWTRAKITPRDNDNHVKLWKRRQLRNANAHVRLWRRNQPRPVLPRKLTKVERFVSAWETYKYAA